jgi:hypothetical protein
MWPVGEVVPVAETQVALGVVLYAILLVAYSVS